MSKIMFFCIPAHGHINPTIGVVKELCKRGHQVRYYAFDEFREKIEDAKAQYVSCDSFLPPLPENIDQLAGKDFAALIEMIVDTTIAMDETIKADMKTFCPDLIVSDSICFWGKLFAKKYHIPFVCSTTTFAFNRYSAKLMKKDFKEILMMIRGMKRIKTKIDALNEAGYDIKDFVSMIQNDNETDTIVYTSKMFQPYAETFSERVVFVGPSIQYQGSAISKKEQPLVYISLGTVLNQNLPFYRACIEALKDMDCKAVISAGRNTDLKMLESIASNVSVLPYVNQLEILSEADVFLTHCGMNSVSESLYMGVPMVLFPQHSEEAAVAARVCQLNAGILLKKGNVRSIRKAIETVLSDTSYQSAAQRIKEDFRNCKGAYQAADLIEALINRPFAAQAD